MTVIINLYRANKANLLAKIVKYLDKNGAQIEYYWEIVCVKRVNFKCQMQLIHVDRAFTQQSSNETYKRPPCQTENLSDATPFKLTFFHFS